MQSLISDRILKRFMKRRRWWHVDSGGTESQLESETTPPGPAEGTPDCQAQGNTTVQGRADSLGDLTQGQSERDLPSSDDDTGASGEISDDNERLPDAASSTTGSSEECEP